MKSRHPYGYSLAFAVVNFAEALVLICTLGMWCPMWTMSFTSWYMRHKFSQPRP